MVMLSSESNKTLGTRACLSGDLTPFSVLCLNSGLSRLCRLQARSTGLIMYPTPGFFVVLLHQVQIVSQTDVTQCLLQIVVIPDVLLDFCLCSDQLLCQTGLGSSS